MEQLYYRHCSTDGASDLVCTGNSVTSDGHGYGTFSRGESSEDGSSSEGRHWFIV